MHHDLNSITCEMYLIYPFYPMVIGTSLFDSLLEHLDRWWGSEKEKVQVTGTVRRTKAPEWQFNSVNSHKNAGPLMFSFYWIM
jgi:hypothetical protein